MPNGIQTNVDLGSSSTNGIQTNLSLGSSAGGTPIGSITVPNAPTPSGGIVHWIGHEVGRTVSNVEDMAINAIPGTYHLVGGLINHPVSTIENVGKSYLQVAEHPLRNPGYTLADILGLTSGAGAVLGRTAEVGGIVSRGGALDSGLADSIASTVEKNPGMSVADAASSLGRKGELNRAVDPLTGEPKSVGSQVTQALIHGLAPRERLLTDSESGLAPQHGWWYSKNPTIRAAQNLVDQAHLKFPDSTTAPIWKILNPLLWRSQAGRISSAAKALAVTEKNTERAAGQIFARKYAGLSDPMHLAARMVAEGTTADALKAMHEKWMDSGILNEKALSETQKRLPVIDEANQLLDEETHTLPSGRQETVPVPKPDQPELQKYISEAKLISDKRTTAARVAGILSHESHISRTVGPMNFVKYGEVPETLSRIQKQITGRENAHLMNPLIDHAKNAEKLALLHRRLERAKGNLTDEERASLPSGEYNPLVGDDSEALVKQAGLFRVPYEIEKPGLRSFGSTAFRRAWKGGTKEPPSTFTHHFQGGVLKHGGGITNTAKLLAESYTEAHRFLAFKANRDRILATGKKTPAGIPAAYRVLMRDDRQHIPGVLSHTAATERAFLEKPSLNPDESVAAGRLYEGLRAHTFPQVRETLSKISGVTHDQISKLLTSEDEKGFRAIPGYVWVDKRTLGGLDKQNPLFSSFDEPKIRSAFHLFDAVNNAQKAAVLYLKPAYAVPNMLGNAALNLVQQGFLAPLNLAKSVFAFRMLDDETRAIIKGGMGEGFADTLKQEGFHGGIARATNKLAAGYGKFVDDPFRFSAFLHEARLNGFVTKEQLHALTHEERFHEELHGIFNRANDEIINYERLGPGEQAVLRRLVFFYPWVKGSTRYASQFVKNHPVTAGLTGEAGQQGTDFLKKEFPGGLPSYAEGLIPFGKNHEGLQNVLNPSSAAILNEPADLLKLAANLVQGHPNPDLTFASNLAPGDAGLLALLTAGQVTSVPHPASWSPIHSALNETFGGNPLLQLKNSLTGKPKANALYPDSSVAHALLRYALLGGLASRTLNVPKAALTHYRQTHPTGLTG